MEIDEEIIDQIRTQLDAIDASPFFLCISGSDNYGFSSVNNSDVDIRGAYYFRNPEEMFNEDWSNPKKILHSLRPLMTVIHYMESRQYEPNIQVLVKQEYLAYYANLIEVLIELKKSRRSTNPIIKKRSNDAYDEMEAWIKENRGKIPEKGDVQDRIKMQVTDIRMATLRFHGHC